MVAYALSLVLLINIILHPLFRSRPSPQKTLNPQWIQLYFHIRPVQQVQCSPQEVENIPCMRFKVFNSKRYTSSPSTKTESLYSILGCGSLIQLSESVIAFVRLHEKSTHNSTTKNKCFILINLMGYISLPAKYAQYNITLF